MNELSKIVLDNLPLFDIIRFRRINNSWLNFIDSNYDNNKIELIYFDGVILIRNKYLELNYNSLFADQGNQNRKELLISGIDRLISKFNHREVTNHYLYVHGNRCNGCDKSDQCDEFCSIRFLDGNLRINDTWTSEFVISIRNNEIKIMRFLFDLRNGILNLISQD